jgi:branched-chain amino acid transport system ATP-binding protein
MTTTLAATRDRIASAVAAPHAGPGAAARCAEGGVAAPLGNVDAAAVLSVRGLVKRYGGLVVTQDVDLDLRRGEVHALVGPNGAGKTTLLGQLTGDVQPDAGRIHFDGHDITRLPVHRRARLGLGRSFQITSVFPDLTVLENALLAIQAHAGHSFRFWRPALADGPRVEAATALLAKTGLAAQAERPAEQLSHGEHRQLEIAIALAGRPQVLLLDEPMAGMGIEDSAALTKMLLAMKGTVSMLLVEHDMSAVFALADRISVLVYGQRIATGTPAEIRADAEVRRAYLGDDEAAA